MCDGMSVEIVRSSWTSGCHIEVVPLADKHSLYHLHDNSMHSLPTSSQGLPNTSPPTSRHLPNTSPPTSRHLPDTSPPTSRHLPDTSPPISRHLPDTSPPTSSHHLPDTSPPTSSHHLPDTSPPTSSNHLPDTSPHSPPPEAHNLPDTSPHSPPPEAYNLHNTSPHSPPPEAYNLHNTSPHSPPPEAYNLHNTSPHSPPPEAYHLPDTSSHSPPPEAHHLPDTSPHSPPPEDHKRTAPDGGYGWFLVLGCFLAHVVFAGLDRSEGIFFLLLTSQFGQSAQLTSWPGAMASTLQLVLGPIANLISHRYSVRVSAFLGGVLMFIGLLLNSLASNIYFYFISHSLIDGIGRGIAYVPGLVIVGMYFDKRAGLAMGLATSGSGVGTLVIVPLAQFLADNYGFHGTFLILAGFASHICVAAMLYRPLASRVKSMTSDNKVGRRGPDEAQGWVGETLNETEARDPPTNEDENERESTSQKNEIVSLLELRGVAHSLKPETYKRTSQSSISETEVYQDSEPETLYNVPPRRRLQDQASETESLYNKPTRRGDQDSESETLYNMPPRRGLKDQASETESLYNKPTRRGDQDTEPETLYNVPPRRGLQDQDSETESLYNKPTRRGLKDEACLKPFSPMDRSSRRQTNKIFRLDLLTKPSFLMYCLSILTFTMAFRAAFTFIPALMESKGIPRSQLAFALSSAGAADTLGRIGFGFLIDLRRLRPVRLVLYNMVIFGVSFAAFLLPSLGTLSSFCLVSSLYGLLTGAYISQKSVVLSDILDANDMASSFGLLMVFQGIGNLLGPPLSGAFKDAFGDFDKSFYIGGGLLLVSGLLMAICNVVNILQKHRKAVQDGRRVI